MPARFQGEFPRYVPAEERRARYDQERERFRPEDGVIATDRKITKTFWGDAWCRNLEVYSDFASRLPRGRSYLRAGSVMKLEIQRGSVAAQVLGTSMYRVTVLIRPLSPERWKAIRARCAGRIDSLVALLRGELPKSVMEVVTEPGTGLFPSPSEIAMECTCPDWAALCKHIAAVLYGIGVRFDAAPELLFRLRGVDHAELVQAAPALWSEAEPGARRLEGDLSALFGIDLVDDTEPPPEPSPRPARRAARRRPRRKA
jgi:uncharacterized Zn finger protein